MNGRSLVVLLAIHSSATLVGEGRAQGFLNLDFEAANVSGYSPGDGAVPLANALPGWGAIYTSSINTDITSQVGYDAISLGGAVITIIDSISGIPPISGDYSALLYGGGSNPLYSSTISQTGLVPAGTRSLLVDAKFSGASFIVNVGGQAVRMVELQAFPTYNLYGGDISSLAGQTVALSFTEPPSTGVQPSSLLLDNILFSSQAIPEPGVSGLLALGVVALGLTRARGGR